MKIKLAGQIIAVTLTSMILVLITASSLAAEEPIDNSEYIYCCQNNRQIWGRGRHGRNYNPDKVETINGKVVRVDTHTSRRGLFEGVHLIVDTGKETVDVHLGPSWYLKERDFDFVPEDKITIVGAKVDLNGEQAIFAHQIQKGDAILLLREENGFPLWRGHGWQQ